MYRRVTIPQSKIRDFCQGLLQNVSFAAVLFCLPWQFSVASKGYMNSLCFIWSIAKLTGKRLTVWLWIISECYSL